MVTHSSRPTRRSARRRRSLLPCTVAVIALLVLTLGTVLESAAQSIQIQARPTATPTEEFDPGFQAEPTAVPTDEPDRVSPTEVPTEEPQPAAPSSLTITKGACDDSGFDPYTATGLQTFLDACHSPDGEFEFTVANDGAFNLTASTELGSLFTQVPTGPVTITETIPDGWGEPAVFCWSNLFPTPADTPFIGNSPQWDVQEGEDVECWWFNVSEPEATGHTIRIEKRVCPDGFVVSDDYWTLASGCQEHLEGIGFALTTDGGAVQASTDASGEIAWTGVDLGASGQVQLDEAIPEGYSEPVVWCVNFPVEAADAQDFDFFQVDSTDGLVSAIPEQDAPYIFQCTYFNVNTGVAPGDLADPATGGSGDSHDFYLDKYECPEGFDATGDWQAFSLGCTTPMDAGFNVTDGQGPMFQETAGGHAEWIGIDFGDGGDLVITETVPEGYGEPVVFCSILPAGAADPEDFDTQQMTVADGRVTAAPVLGEQDHYHCAYFNMPDGGAPGDLTTTDPQADGEGVTVTVIKHRCPLGAPEDTTYDQYIVICADNFPDLQFTLEHQGGAFPAETNENGEVEWTNVPAGEITIQEALTAQYLDPLAFCGFFAGEQELQFGQQDASGGLLALTIPDDATNVTCWLFNIKNPDAENTIRVHKWICPPGTFTGSHEKNDYLSACSDDHAGVNFTLTAPHGEFADATDADGVIEWSTVPLGDFSIQEEIPEGYGEPVVFCNFADVIQGLGYQHGPPMRVSAPGGLVSAWIEDPNVEYLCYYFNIPESTTSVVVNKRLCPPGFDENAQNPASNCNWPVHGVVFTLGDLETSTGDFLDGMAVFMDFPPGDYALTEAVPENIDHAFPGDCTNNGQDVDAVMGSLDPPSIELTINEGDHWICDWYNVPVVESRVVVEKRTCPDGVDFVLTDENTIDDVIAACPTAGDGIEFTLDHAAGSSTQDISGGVAVWDGVPNGPVTITETIPPGYLEPVWYCDSNVYDEDGDLVVDFQLGQVDAPAGVLTESLDEPYGEIFSCWVFNVLDPDATTVTVVKWLCPPGFDIEVDDPVAECTEPMDNVNFMLNDLVATTGNAGLGIAVFEDVLPGDDYELTEFLPGDIASAFVTHCVLNDDDVLVPLSEEMPPIVILDIDEGDHWVCHWYNVPSSDNDVLIHKWLCPEGFDPYVANNEYFDTCTEALDGITFKAMSDLGIAVLDTVGGQVGFGGFPAGMEVGIQEEIPGEYGNPYVICEFDDGQWHDVGAQAGFFELSFAGSGETVECHVFNFHGEDPDLTILKWTCPVGYDLYAEGADPPADCTEATNGIVFELRHEGNPALVETQTTGEVVEGGVFFDGLEPDVYNVAELVPDGIAFAFVLECTGHNMGMLQPYPLQFGSVLDDIDLDAGEHLTCHWYNVPAGEGGAITVYKYTCATEAFVSEVDCQIFEAGKTFDLLHWNTETGAWDVIETQVTDGVGRIQWTSVETGDYRLDEHDGEWCHLTTSPVFGPGDGFSVIDGQETVVHVYNCDGTPGQPGETPKKYPNTGVPPESATPVALWQQGGEGGGNGILGPFGGLVGIAFLAWRVVFIARRTAQQREERDERAWHEEAAAQDRPAWLTGPDFTARTARPAWMTRDDDPLTRPASMVTER